MVAGVGSLVLVEAGRRRDAVSLCPGFGHDRDQANQDWEKRVRLLGRDLNHIVVDHADLDDTLADEGQVGGVTKGALYAEDHVLRGEWRAVVEGYAGAQMKPPSGRLNDLPADRQTRLQIEVRVNRRQALVNLTVAVEAGSVNAPCGSQLSTPSPRAQRTTFSAVAGSAPARINANVIRARDRPLNLTIGILSPPDAGHYDKSEVVTPPGRPAKHFGPRRASLFRGLP
jgi:hypothetical protein